MGFNPLSIIKDGIEGILGGATSLIDEIVTSDEEKRTLKVELERVLNEQKTRLIDQATELFKAQRDVIVAEARGESWLQRSWRPIAMLTFLYVIIHLMVLTPLFGIPAPDPTKIPSELWALLQIGIGGYIAGRTVEKTAKVIRTNGDK